VEMEFRGDATELKKHRNFFQILRESNLATVKKKFPTSRSVEWQLYQSEVDLWAVFGMCLPSTSRGHIRLQCLQVLD
jgi:hypothetical protein